MGVNLKTKKNKRNTSIIYVYIEHILIKIIENDVIAHFSRKIIFIYLKSCENQECGKE